MAVEVSEEQTASISSLEGVGSIALLLSMF
jgi:hypothetical protein